jgi:hypothetical protein
MKRLFIETNETDLIIGACVRWLIKWIRKQKRYEKKETVGERAEKESLHNVVYLKQLR